jgi:hypothetical protein
VIQEDRELLTELARLKQNIALLGMCIMNGSVSAAERQDYARLIAVGEQLRRANDTGVVEGESVVNGRIGLPGPSVETYWKDTS